MHRTLPQRTIPPSTTGTPWLDNALGELVAVQWTVGHQLLAAVARCPRLAVPIALAAGARRECFGAHDDLAAIWLGFEVAAGRNEDAVTAACNARFLLKRVGHWFPEEPASETTSRWSDERLARLMFAHTFDQGHIKLRSEQLADIHDRLADAQLHIVYVARLLRGEAA